MLSSQVEILTFGAFRLDPAGLTLFEASKPVRLGSRALSILIALVERAGDLVTKEELLNRVWPDTFVDEGNLRVHIAALRKVLGDGHSGARYIGNVPGRGYRFVAPVAVLTPGAIVDREPVALSVPAPGHDLPTSLVRLIGRGHVVQDLTEQLGLQRFVTIVAPGGMGKTAVALAVAERLGPAFVDGVRFVDLAPLTDPGLVSSALANALPVVGAAATRAAQIRSYLADRQILLVLDNCEQVREAVAALAVELLAVAPRLHLLVTSRAPLNAPREIVSLLPSLEAPLADAALDATAALGYAAVQLFV
ncbi:MAG TPA: winged helix-turn-helix domain-containing protein, partial [Polyangiaceae bacterium]